MLVDVVDFSKTNWNWIKIVLDYNFVIKSRCPLMYFGLFRFTLISNHSDLEIAEFHFEPFINSNLELNGVIHILLLNFQLFNPIHLISMINYLVFKCPKQKKLLQMCWVIKRKGISVFYFYFEIQFNKTKILISLLSIWQKLKDNNVNI